MLAYWLLPLTLIFLFAMPLQARQAERHILEVAPLQTVAGHLQLSYVKGLSEDFSLAIGYAQAKMDGAHPELADQEQRAFVAVQHHQSWIQLPEMYLQAGLGWQRHLHGKAAPRDAITYQLGQGSLDFWSNDHRVLALQPGVGWRMHWGKSFSMAVHGQIAVPLYHQVKSRTDEVLTPGRDLQTGWDRGLDPEVILYAGLVLP